MFMLQFIFKNIKRAEKRESFSIVVRMYVVYMHNNIHTYT